MCTGRRSTMLARREGARERPRLGNAAGDGPVVGRDPDEPVLQQQTVASSAPHTTRALRGMVSSTGWRSVGELEMTRRISAVAVCCSSASVSSRLRLCSSLNRRTFSIAMTAWSAKVFSSAICLSVKGRTSCRR